MLQSCLLPTFLSTSYRRCMLFFECSNRDNWIGMKSYGSVVLGMPREIMMYCLWPWLLWIAAERSDILPYSALSLFERSKGASPTLHTAVYSAGSWRQGSLEHTPARGCRNARTRWWMWVFDMGWLHIVGNNRQGQGYSAINQGNLLNARNSADGG
jgi:hypothetical protein